MVLGTWATRIGTAGLEIDLAAGIGRVVAADGHQHGHVEPAEHVQHVAHVAFGLGRVGARGAEDGAAAEVDGLDVVDGQLAIVVGVALDQPLEAVAEADHLDALLDGLDGHRADDAVDPRRRTAADQESEFARAN